MTIMIGLAKTDITPNPGIKLVGYNLRNSNGVDMPLRAEIMICKNLDSAWVLVCCDLVGIKRALNEIIRSAIAEICNLKTEQIMISSSHTHSAPNCVKENFDPNDKNTQEYHQFLIQRLVTCAAMAIDDLKESEFCYFTANTNHLTHNRRVQNEETGEWGNIWLDLDGRHNGYRDETIHCIGVTRDGNLDGILFNYACHPVCLGPDSLSISPDYVGYCKKELEEGTGIKQSMFLLAGCANINPRDALGKTPKQALAFGQKLAAAIKTALSKSYTNIEDYSMSSDRKEWHIIRNPKKENQKDQFDTELQVLRCGELSIISLPGELFCEYNAMIREVSRSKITLIASMTNDYIGYLPTDQGYREGAYESRQAPAPNLESQIMRMAKELLI